MKHIVVFITLLGVLSCREQPVHLSRINATQRPVDSTLVPDDSLEAFILPYHQHVEEELSKPLAYAPKTLSKTDGILNSSIGNLMADIVLEETNALMNRQGNPPVDLVLLNQGGIRSVISKGIVNEHTAYQVMPFENTIFVLPMSGKAVRNMVAFLISEGRPHPIAGMSIRVNADNSLKSVEIGGVPFEEGRTYRVATSGYLAGGGDGMSFFKEGGPAVDTGYKIRNAMVDYFIKVDTLHAEVDDRFIKDTDS